MAGEKPAPRWLPPEGFGRAPQRDRHPGAVPPPRGGMEKDKPMNTRAKILSRDTVIERIAEHRRRGQRIVLANGCFDLLHVGHVRYLEGARREGAALVVGIHSDSSEGLL